MGTSPSASWFLKLSLFSLITINLVYSSASSTLHSFTAVSLAEHQNYTAISEFRVVNRRKLLPCSDPNPFLQISVSPDNSMSDSLYLTVAVCGVLLADSSDWVAMISPSTAE